MAKGIGNDIPLGAVVTTPEIAKVLTRQRYYSCGNPVCTAAGWAVLKVIEKEKLQENAFVVRSHLKERLKALKDKYDEVISDVRGQGFVLPHRLSRSGFPAVNSLHSLLLRAKVVIEFELMLMFQSVPCILKQVIVKTMHIEVIECLRKTNLVVVNALHHVIFLYQVNMYY
ncbi:unnamed protein product [Trifolium pratense]|uniref:Uncharacterized protein n=1 Tax=Trifolium pratense TaxID=57577 RepID=A0ACB0IP59_TRIPR|nr:unnamed protein product [Trifolium pratense]